MQRRIAEELKWKDEWIDVFFLEYRSYEENDLINLIKPIEIIDYSILVNGKDLVMLDSAVSLLQVSSFGDGRIVKLMHACMKI